MNLTDPEAVLLELEAELARARSELAHYESLLQDLPAIYEGKFRQHLRATAQNIRQLLDERKLLQEQVSIALANPPKLHSLSAVADDGPEGCHPRRDLAVHFPSFLPFLKLGIFFRSASKSFASLWARSSLPWKSIAVSGGALLGLAIISYSLFPASRLGPPDDSQKLGKSAVLPRASALTVVAKGGQSWILIEGDGGRLLHDVVLGDGETRTVNIGSGLRIRSGRPDLLYFGIGSEPLKRLGGVSDLDWTEIRQPI